MTSKRPYIKFYFADWLSDKNLKLVPRDARSFLIDLMAIMHEAEPYGHLLLGGRPPSVDELAAITGDDPRLVLKMLHKLLTSSVVKTNEAGVIYSTRMVRDHEKSLKYQEAGARGGNPALKRSVKLGGKPKSQRVNPQDKLIAIAREEEGYPSGNPSSSRAVSPTAQPPEGAAAGLPAEVSPLEKTDPRWTKVRQAIGEVLWNTWFPEVFRSEEDERMIWAPSQFARERIEIQFGSIMEKVFNGPVQVRAFLRRSMA